MALSKAQMRKRCLPYAITPIACIAPQPIKWLWSGRLPLGKISLLIGDPGLGKSLVTISIAAAASVGACWPDGAEGISCGALLLSAEDDAADTIRPRLEAAGADLERVHILYAARQIDDSDRSLIREFCLQKDIAVLDDLLETHPDIRLVVIDPLSAYLAGVDSHNNAEVRGLLAPLSELAARRGVAVLCVSHMNKAAGQNPMYRATGSLAFTAAARAVWLVTRDEQSGRRLLLPLKCNLSLEPHGLAFNIESPDGDVPVVRWFSEPVTVSAAEALAAEHGPSEHSELREAIEWLRDLLEAGPLPAREVKAQARESGIAWRTVRRAQERLRIRPAKTAFAGGWSWALPKMADSPTFNNKLDTFDEVGHLRSKPAGNQRTGELQAGLNAEDGQDSQDGQGQDDKPDDRVRI